MIHNQSPQERLENEIKWLDEMVSKLSNENVNLRNQIANLEKQIEELKQQQ